MYERVVDEDGVKHGIGDGLILTVFPDAPDAEIFQRHAIKTGVDGAEKERVCWLVGKLDGVHLYVMGSGRLIMTKQDLNP